MENREIAVAVSGVKKTIASDKSAAERFKRICRAGGHGYAKRRIPTKSSAANELSAKRSRLLTESISRSMKASGWE